jgi:hypothetical protein
VLSSGAAARARRGRSWQNRQVLRRISTALARPAIACTAPLAAGALALAGCVQRTAAPDLSRPAAPAGFHALGYPADGVALLAPTNWPLRPGRAPLVATFSSGDAVVALWRYPRSEAPPAGAAGLADARAALLAAARARDPGLRLIRAATVEIDHAGALELDAFERIGGSPRRVLSLHVYVPGAEIVLEEYAPAAGFHAVDHAVFSPVRRSLRLIPSGVS